MHCLRADECYTIVECMKDRLRDRKHGSVVLYTLVLIESCIKNCGQGFITAIADHQFMRILEDLGMCSMGDSKSCMYPIYPFDNIFYG